MVVVSGREFYGDINVSKSKDALKHFTKINNMFKDATKSDKYMNDILQGLQM